MFSHWKLGVLVGLLLVAVDLWLMAPEFAEAAPWRQTSAESLTEWQRDNPRAVMRSFAISEHQTTPAISQRRIVIAYRPITFTTVLLLLAPVPLSLLIEPIRRRRQEAINMRRAVGG